MRYIDKFQRETDVENSCGRSSHGRSRRNGSRKRRQLGKLALGLVLVMGMTQLQPVLASKVNEATNKKNEAQQNLNNANKEIDQLEKQQEALQSELDSLDSELGDVLVSLGIVESDIARAEERLVQVQADLKQAQENEAAQYEAMKKRIRFMYEKGDTAYLTSILESRSMAELLNRVEYVNEVYDYDRQMLEEFQATRIQVEELEIEVESELADLEELQNSYKEEEQRYETLIAQKKKQISNFDAKLADVKKLAKEMQKTIEKQNEIIRKAQEEETNNSNNTGNVSGNKNPSYTTNVDRNELVEFACRFIGNPYEFGGDDINNGIDCSGFTKYVYGHFGITLPRYSGDQRQCGQAVSYNNAQPGDLIFYKGHVAIYIGDGKIVHASNSKPYPAGGIKISTATYNTILAIRRVL